MQSNNPWGQRTAESFMRLAALRGVSSMIHWDDGANTFVAYTIGPDLKPGVGEKVGQSVHGLYDWLNKQPGVKP